MYAIIQTKLSFNVFYDNNMRKIAHTNTMQDIREGLIAFAFVKYIKPSNKIASSLNKV